MRGVIGVVKKNGKFLLGIESKDSPIKGKWRLLGGKIEGEETSEEALKRELLEEAGIEVEVGSLLGEKAGSYSPIIIGVYLAEHKYGDPTPKAEEIGELREFSLEEIKELDMDCVSKAVFEEYSHLF